MMQPQQQPMGRSGQPPQGRPQAQQLSPEQQKQAEQVVMEVKQMMSANNGAIMKELVNALKDPQVDRVQVIATALVEMAKGLSAKLGLQDEQLLAGAAMTMLSILEQGMQAAKAQPFTPEERKAIIRQAVTLFREAAGQGGQQGQPPQGQPMGQPPMPQQGALAMAAGV
jgi:hypothetical protein